MTDSAEEWRPVVGYEGTYQVSSLGRIYSNPRPYARGGLLKQDLRAGYRSVTLSQGNATERFTVHRLVCAAFFGPCPPGLVVRHLDGNAMNCRAHNLAYGTVSENRLDAVRHGTHHHTAKTHCSQRHAYTPDNIYRSPSRPNERRCRACNREKARTRRAAQRQG